MGMPSLNTKRDVTAEELHAVMNPSPQVQVLRRGLGLIGDGLDPVVDLYRPYVDGLAALPRDGRFLLVGNHTSFGAAEVFFVPYFVRRELGRWVRPLAERGMGDLRGPMKDVLSAYGGVVGHPDTARELMRHDETVLVFPGGGREMPKFKGEEYQLKWDGRSGFAREAIAAGYPIVPVGLVGGDDVYRGVTERDGTWGRLSQAVGQKLAGDTAMVFPLVRGLGPTLIPNPTRMYLRFGAPIDTTKPARTAAPVWEATVKDRTQGALETILADLQQVQSADPYRHLNPLAWRNALQPAPAGDPVPAMSPKG